MNSLRVLVLDDEKDLAASMCEILTTKGFVCDYINNPLDIFEKIENFKPDVLLLDQRMPEKNGLIVLKELRENPTTFKLPIIMVTANHSKYDQLSSYETGIDDFVSKPFDFDLLEARIKTLHARLNIKEKFLELSNIKIDLNGHTVLVDGRELKLTNAEFNFLRVLMSNVNVALDRNALCQAALGKKFVSSRTIDVHILSLRKKLEDHSKHIETVYGFGYKFVA